MRRRTFIIGAGAAALLVAGGLTVATRRGVRDQAQALPAIPPTEQQQTIEALKRPGRARPVIAIIALNAGTEVSDLFTTYGILAESGVADVTVVAPRSEPIRLYPTVVSLEKHSTTAQFDASHPRGADYVVVPAMEPADDPDVIAWIRAQHARGATIVSVCNGSQTLAAAGLLDGRRATGHWYYLDDIREKHPTMQWVRDRRYVVDRGVATSTGITASVPYMIALVEAIAGSGKAEKLAARLGVDSWDARHDSSRFQLTVAHRTTYVLNNARVWRHETIGVPLDNGVDEIALGLVPDAYARTEFATVLTIGKTGDLVQTRRGLTLRPAATDGGGIDAELRLPDEPAGRILDRELPRIATRYDDATAAYVALILEYPWPA